MANTASPPDFSKREVRVTQALANPIVFGEIYFRPFDPNWTTALPSFASEMMAFAVGVKRGVIVLPPEFLKTTLVSQVYAIWLTVRAAAFGKLLRGMLMSEEEGMAKANLQVIKWHIENNERLISDFRDSEDRPLVRPSKSLDVWRDDAIIIERRGQVSRDPTWQAKGLDSKGIHGRRLDVFIGDDLVTPRNAASPAMRKSALDVMDLQVRTRIVSGGQMLVAANFNDDKDLPSVLSRRDNWQTFRRPSIYRAGFPAISAKDSELRDPEKSHLTWPANWSRERLLVEYDETPNRFRRIHLLDPRAESGERLSTGWIVEVEAEQIPVRYARFYIGVDPAPGGETDDLDFFNITVAARSETNLDIVESFSIRCDTPRQCELLGLMHDRYQRIGQGVQAIGVSRVALDGYFRGAMKISRPQLSHKIEAIATQGSKEQRLEGLGPYAQVGWLRFSGEILRNQTSNLQDRHQELTLEEEWRDFPFGRHDDRLDGLDMAIRTANEFALVGEREEDVLVAGD